MGERGLKSTSRAALKVGARSFSLISEGSGGPLKHLGSRVNGDRRPGEEGEGQ